MNKELKKHYKILTTSYTNVILDAFALYMCNIEDEGEDYIAESGYKVFTETSQSFMFQHNIGMDELIMIMRDHINDNDHERLEILEAFIEVAARAYHSSDQLCLVA